MLTMCSCVTTTSMMKRQNSSIIPQNVLCVGLYGIWYSVLSLALIYHNNLIF